MSVLLVLAGLLAGCSSHESKQPLLRTGAADVCGPAPTFLVTARADGQFGLGAGVFDSARLVTALHNVIPPTPNKVVMVSADSGRAGTLPWIVAAIRREGGEAYALDTTCLKPQQSPYALIGR